MRGAGSAATGRKGKGLSGVRRKGGAQVWRASPDGACTSPCGDPARSGGRGRSCPPPTPLHASSRRATRERVEGEPWAQPRASGAAPGESPGGCSELRKRGIWQARGGESVFVNAGLLLYIMYFPVYNKEGDYNNFTSAHSWPVLTLGIRDALFLYKRPGLGLCFVLLDFIYIYLFSYKTDVTVLIRGPEGFRCSWRCRLFPQPPAAQTCVSPRGDPVP